MKFPKKTFLFLLLLALAAFFAKPTKKGGGYPPYFRDLNRTLQTTASGQPAFVIDLDSLDHNAERITKALQTAYALRLVVKSLPSLELLDYLVKKTKARGMMVFHARYLPVLVGHFGGTGMDYLLGKPWPVSAAKAALQALPEAKKKEAFASVQWLIDTEERLLAYLAWAKAEKTKLRVSLEIDVGLRRGGFPDAQAVAKALALIHANPLHLDFSGCMGYDGHVPHTPFPVPSQKAAILRAFDSVLQRYQAIVEASKKAYPSLFQAKLTFNGGGSKTYALYPTPPRPTAINDISIGSAFLQPSNFEIFTLADHRPAVFIGTPVLKKLRGNHVPFVESLDRLLRWWNPNRAFSFYIYGGGWSRDLVAPEGLEIEPLTSGPSQANLLPNQSLLIGSEDVQLQQEDFVFFRPLEGDSMLPFESLLVVRKAVVLHRWKSFPLRF